MSYAKKQILFFFHTARFYRAVFFAFLDALSSVLLLLLIGAIISGPDDHSAKASVLEMILPQSLSHESQVLLFWILVAIKTLAFGAKNYSNKSLSHQVATHMRLSTITLNKRLKNARVSAAKNFVSKGIVVILADGLFLLLVSLALLNTQPLIALGLWIFIGLGILVQIIIAKPMLKQHQNSNPLKSKISHKENLIRTHWLNFETWQQLGKELRILQRRTEKHFTVRNRQIITQSIAESLIPALFFSFMGIIIFTSEKYWNMTSAMQLQCVLLLIYCQSPSRRILRSGRYIRHGWQVMRESLEAQKMERNAAIIEHTSNSPILSMAEISGVDKSALNTVLSQGISGMHTFQKAHNNIAFFALALELKGETLLSALSFHREKAEREQLATLIQNFEMKDAWLNEKIASLLNNITIQDKHRLALIKCLNAPFEYIIANQNEINQTNLSKVAIEKQLQQAHKKLIIC